MNTLLRQLFLTFMGVAAFAADAPPNLVSSGLPKGAAEAVLPSGALLHVRLGKLAASLDSLDALVMSFVPEQAVPQLTPFLKEPHPLLTFLGQQAAGETLGAPLVAKLLGLDITRPLSLSFYAMDPHQGWILALPMADAKQVGGLLMNALRPRQFVGVDLGGRAGWHLVGTNPDLPKECWALCSDDTLYLFGSQALAAMTAQPAGGKHLADDPLFANAAANNDATAGDISLAVNTAFAKPIISLVAQQYATIPPPVIAKLRSDFLRGLDPDTARSLSTSLRMWLGVRSVDQGLDYLECLATASVETMVPALSEALLGFDGLTLRIDLGGEAQRVRLALVAKDIDPAAATKPLPIGEIAAAIAALPAGQDSASATGQEPGPVASPLPGKWLLLLADKFKAKNLPRTYVQALARYWQGRKLVLPLAAKLPWTVSATYQPAMVPGPLPTTLAAYVAAIQPTIVPLPMAVFAKQADGFLAAHFTAQVAVENANEQALGAFLAETTGDSRWYDGESRFRSEPRPNGVTRMVYEQAYQTRVGFAGYSQHELINRMIYDSADFSGYQVLQLAQGRNPTWLDQAATIKPAPLAPAVATLLGRVDDGSNSLQIARLLQLLPAAVDQLALIETVAHAEADAYIAKAVTVINAHQGDQDGLIAELMTVDMPVFVTSLNIDAASRQLYCVLPGNLRYPRPLAVPLLAGLLKDYAAKAPELGGALVTTRVRPGRFEATLVQDTRAAAWLVKSAVNAAWRDYLGAPAAQAKFKQLVIAPGDGQHNDPATVILYNTLWPRG